MTVLGFAEHLEKCISDRADEMRADKSNAKVTYTAIVGRQAFSVTIEELAKETRNRRPHDRWEPF